MQGSALLGDYLGRHRISKPNGICQRYSTGKREKHCPCMRIPGTDGIHNLMDMDARQVLKSAARLKDQGTVGTEGCDDRA